MTNDFFDSLILAEQFSSDSEMITCGHNQHSKKITWKGSGLIQV